MFESKAPDAASALEPSLVWCELLEKGLMDIVMKIPCVFGS